jgi:hypothetical protein
LLEGTDGGGKALWRDFVPYLQNHLDSGKFHLITPCVTGAPNAVPEDVLYYPQGLAILDQFFTGRCQACEEAHTRSHLWCLKRHELFDFYSVCAGAIEVARNVDQGESDYDGAIRYRATVSGVADVPPHDGMVNRVCILNDDWRVLSLFIVRRSAWWQS